jgi:hypothetical protein
MAPKARCSLRSKSNQPASQPTSPTTANNPLSHSFIRSFIHPPPFPYLVLGTLTLHSAIAIYNSPQAPFGLSRVSITRNPLARGEIGTVWQSEHRFKRTTDRRPQPSSADPTRQNRELFAIDLKHEDNIFVHACANRLTPCSFSAAQG